MIVLAAVTAFALVAKAAGNIAWPDAAVLIAGMGLLAFILWLLAR